MGYTETLWKNPRWDSMLIVWLRVHAPTTESDHIKNRNARRAINAENFVKKNRASNLPVMGKLIFLWAVWSVNPCTPLHYKRWNFTFIGAICRYVEQTNHRVGSCCLDITTISLHFSGSRRVQHDICSVIKHNEIIPVFLKGPFIAI